MPDRRLSEMLPGWLKRSRAAEETLVVGLDPAEAAVAGTLERWSAKDLIAHCTSWHANLIAMLEAALRDETPAPPGGSVNEVNERTFSKNQGRAWEEVMAEMAATFDRLAALLPRFSDDDLLAPDHYAWRRGQPLALSVLLRLYWHPMVHVAEFYAQRGNRSAAEAIRDDLQGVASDLARMPPLRGQTLYMVAAVSAALGDTATGLAALRESLALAPHLRDWSRRDPGLAALRGDPRYAALYDEKAADKT